MTRGPKDKLSPVSEWDILVYVGSDASLTPHTTPSPPLRLLCSPKLQEAEERGFVSSQPAAKMTVMLWQVLLVWDLSG